MFPDHLVADRVPNVKILLLTHIRQYIVIPSFADGPRDLLNRRLRIRKDTLEARDFREGDMERRGMSIRL